MRKEIARAMFLGPFLMLYNLILMPEDTGLRTSSLVNCPQDARSVPTLNRTNREIFRRMLLPLDKLMHIQKVTQVSFPEIIMTLLSGALRAHGQVRFYLNFNNKYA